MPDPGAKLMRGLIEAFLLESLEAAPKHGYAILKEMEVVFGVEPNRNKLYPLLARLEKEGLIEGVEDPTSGRGRTAYGLTTRGREELDSYRKLPLAFREALARLWKGAVPLPAPRAEPAGAPAPTPAAASADARVALTVAPAPSARDEKPYPCKDARVNLAKDARTGDLALTLTGCPMGAFAYCPECPVYKSVQGLRGLLFG